VTVFLLSACSNQYGDAAGSAAADVVSPSQTAHDARPPSGSSFKNCRGGKNIHWWVAHIEAVTAPDLEALVLLHLTHADRSPFDPADTETLAAWLREGAKADNLYYAVSTQLAVAELNVRHGIAPQFGTLVLRDQANRELALENASLPWLETLLLEFHRCQ
jgi:hypothetical protein